MKYRDTRNLLNMGIGTFNGEGEYDIPALTGVSEEEYRPTDFVPFSDILAKKADPNKGVHFFLDDYRFERVWSQPLRYIDALSRYRYVLSPDFSMYTDEPRALQIFSHYKKHWFGALLESYGIKVIPTICWSDEYSYSFCFDGEPELSVVAVSSLGVCRDKSAVELFNDGYAEMIAAIHPCRVIFFGKDILDKSNEYAVPVEFHKGYSNELCDRRDEILARKAQREKEAKLCLI